MNIKSIDIESVNNNIHIYKPIHIQIGKLYKFHDIDLNLDPFMGIYSFKFDDFLEYNRIHQDKSYNLYRTSYPHTHPIYKGTIIPIRIYSPTEFLGNIVTINMTSFLCGKEIYICPSNRLDDKIKDGGLYLLEDF